jgi:hypothetical protein
MSFSLTFVNCSDPTSTCENSRYSLGGVSGQCDRESGLCICPDGFNGVDLLSLWNDCHISEVSRTIVYGIALSVSSIGLLVVLAGITRLLLVWKAFLVCEGGLPRIRFPPSSQVSYQRQMMEKRKREVFLVILFNLCNFCWISLGFQIMSFVNPQFAELQRPNALGLLMVSVQIGAIICGLYSILFAWFDALPSFKLFANMFPQIRNYFLVRYPSFIGFMVLFNCAFSCLLSFIVFFLYAVANPEEIDIRVIPGGMTVFAIELIIFMMVLASVCALLLRLLSVFSDETSSRGSPVAGRAGILSKEARDRFTDAKHTIWVMLLLALVAGPISVALCLILAWDPFAIANYFFFVSLLQGAGSLLAIFTVYVFVLRLGYAAPRRNDTGTVEIPQSGDGSMSLDINSGNPKYSFTGMNV